MQIRNGFVSNSSSSSFLVFFPEEITNPAQLFGLLWTPANIERIQVRWAFEQPGVKIQRHYNSPGMTFPAFQSAATNTILQDIQAQGPNNYLYALAILGSGWWEEATNTFHQDGHEFKSLAAIEEAYQTWQANEQAQYEFWELPHFKAELDAEGFKLAMTNEELEDAYRALQEEGYELEYTGALINKLQEIKNYANNHYGDVFYSFSFCDENSTYFGILEHGGLFSDLPCYIESHH